MNPSSKLNTILDRSVISMQAVKHDHFILSSWPFWWKETSFRSFCTRSRFTPLENVSWKLAILSFCKIRFRVPTHFVKDCLSNWSGILQTFKIFYVWRSFYCRRLMKVINHCVVISGFCYIFYMETFAYV